MCQPEASLHPQDHIDPDPLIVDWIGYLDAASHEDGGDAHEAVLRDTMKQKGLQFCGFTHQGSHIPLFSDGKILMMTYRTWGAFMSEILELEFEPLPNPWSVYRDRVSTIEVKTEEDQQSLITLKALAAPDFVDGSYVHWAWLPPQGEQEVLP